VWRADPDGFKPEKLTEGKVDVSPVCAPNGESVYFTDGADFRVKRVSIMGGRVEPVPGTAIPNAVFFPVALSPDGKLLAYIPMITSPETHTATQKLALLNLALSPETALPLADVDPRVGAAGADTSIQFTRDGKSVAYIIEEHGVDNIWIQPLNGSQGRQLTNFTSQYIAAFHWSPDGKSLALLRTDATYDAILLRMSER
jgi:eukaryotic-like serine/threonine-protein kinase